MEKNINYYIALCSEEKEKGKSIEEIVVLLKEAEADQLMSIKSLYYAFKMPLKEADRVVLYSPAWKDYKKFTEEIRNKFFEDFEEKEE